MVEPDEVAAADEVAETGEGAEVAAAAGMAEAVEPGGPDAGAESGVGAEVAEAVESGGPVGGAGPGAGAGVGRVRRGWGSGEAPADVRAGGPAPSYAPPAAPGGSRGSGPASVSAAVLAEVDARVAKLDLPAKVRLLSGAAVFRMQAEPDVGLRAIGVSDGPAGVRGERWDERDTSLALPVAHRARRRLGRGPRRGTRRTARRRGPPQGDRRPARAHPQPAPQPGRRPALRVLLRGPAADRPDRRRLHPRRAERRGRGHRQALRRQRLRDRTPHPGRTPRRTHPARAVHGALRGGGTGRGVGRDVRVQPGRRRHHVGERAPGRTPEGGVGLRRGGGLGLGRGALHRGVGARRAGPRDARPAPAVGRTAGRRRYARAGCPRRSSTTRCAASCCWPPGSARSTACPGRTAIRWRTRCGSRRVRPRGPARPSRPSGTRRLRPCEPPASTASCDPAGSSRSSARSAAPAAGEPREVLRRAVAAGCVLLRNEGGLLPLSAGGAGAPGATADRATVLLTWRQTGPARTGPGAGRTTAPEGRPGGPATRRLPCG